MGLPLLDSTFPEVVMRHVMWGEGKEVLRSDRYRAIADKRTNKLFSIVSSDYKLIRHEDAIENVEKAISENKDLGRYEVITKFYNGGGRMRRTYSFPKIKVEIKPEDNVNLKIELFNSYDVTWPFTLLLGAFSFVCSNGLVVEKKYYQLRKRHVFSLDKISVREGLSIAIRRFNMQTREWRRWTDVLLTPKSYAKVMKTMEFAEKAALEIEKQLNQNSESVFVEDFAVTTLWTFYNILTQYITHSAVSLNHQVEMENRLRKAMTNFRSK